LNIKAVGLSRKNIRELTMRVRGICGLQEELYFPITKFIERILPEIMNGFDYRILPKTEMRDTYGMMNTVSNIMVIREDVYDGAVAGIPRHRFTLCHELGHFILHQPSFVSFARGSIPKYCQPEWQANTFAGELMVPYHLAKNMTVSEISAKCGISKAAAEIQYNKFHQL